MVLGIFLIVGYTAATGIKTLGQANPYSDYDDDSGWYEDDDDSGEADDDDCRGADEDDGSSGGSGRYVYYSCFEDDGGKVIDVAGITQGVLGGYPYTYEDACISSNYIKEYYCNGSYAKVENISCGIVVSHQNYCSYNSVTSNHEVRRNVSYPFCSVENRRCENQIRTQILEVCEEGCTNGMCDTVLVNTCNENDNGLDLQQFGITHGIINNDNYTYSDYCVNNDTLHEYWCNGVGDNFKYEDEFSCGNDYESDPYCVRSGINSYVFKNVTDSYCSFPNGQCEVRMYREVLDYCQHGCTAGVCDFIANSCNDTDGGLDPLWLGSVFGYLNGNYYMDTDTCDGSGRYLTEWQCSGAFKNSTTIDCRDYYTNCTLGACI